MGCEISWVNGELSNVEAKFAFMHLKIAIVD